VSRPALVLLAAVLGCARIAPPPGGPPDRLAPDLLATRPDSLGSYPDFEGDVEFQFDEVVSEGGQPNFGLGTGDLERLVVLSPAEEVPVVRWRRDRITVHPREGWRPNTVYRVELMAGVRDLRNNISRSTTVVTFTTGTELPSDSLTGLVVDWTTSRPAPGALIEAVLMPDSLVYRTQADSTGRFRFGPLPRGEYLVYGAIDQNRNARLESRELFDSVRVAAGRDSVGELWAFRHDSVPPRITTVARVDSLAASVTFSSHLDPYQRLPADSVRVLLLPDSTAIAVEAVLPQAAYDSLYRPRDTARDTSEVADTTRAADTTRVRDTAAAVPPAPPGPTDTTRIPGQPPRRVIGARTPVRDTSALAPLRTRPQLFDRLVVRMRQPLRDSARYVFLVNGVRSVAGIAGSARGVLVIEPPRTPADTAKPDTTVAPARPDTARRDTTTSNRRFGLIVPGAWAGITVRHSVRPPE
jgi:hypothetical protein